MKDSAIKGTGNSRYLKSVEDFLVRYPTYADFAAALTDGTLPIDLNGINADGFQQVGDSLGKATLLKDGTAALYGLGTDALPNDVFSLLGNYIPYPYGLLIVHVSDSNGDGVPAKINASPSIGDVSILHVMERGYYSILAEPGAYNLTPATDYPFSTIFTQAQTAIVKQGEPVVINFSAEKNTSGEFDFTESTELFIPEFVAACDLFGVGGGASGSAIVYSGTSSGICGGGAGYTTTLLAQNLSGKMIKIVIGAGGSPVSTTGSYRPPNNGGATKVIVDDAEILVANGGQSSDGGSGGGEAYYSTINTSYVGNGGSDGSDGENGGTGQGTTTRKFGEEENTLYSGAGGGSTYYSASKIYEGAGGDGGGANGKASYTSTEGATITGNSATNYGSGGGAMSLKKSSSSLNATAISGAGYQGLASIRW